MTIDPYILAFSALTVTATLWMGFWAARKSKTASDFFVAAETRDEEEIEDSPEESSKHTENFGLVAIEYLAVLSYFLYEMYDTKFKHITTHNFF